MSNTKQALQERADALEKELKGLREEISAMPDDKWVPQYGEKYWFVADFGKAESLDWMGNGYDKNRLAFNNVFPTKEKAEQARDVIKGMCWDEFPEGKEIEYLYNGAWTPWSWSGSEWQRAMFRHKTLREKK